MPNLDNIFNKFFPQSQTTKKGVFLLRMAWGVEILVAIIGLFVGILIIRGAQGVTDASGLIERNISLNDLTIGLIFIIVAVVELTKIPLATAVYYSVRLFWKIVFIIALILVNVSTFETIITGFERINRERTKVVDKLIVEYNGVKTKITIICPEHGDIDMLPNDHVAKRKGNTGCRHCGSKNKNKDRKVTWEQFFSEPTKNSMASTPTMLPHGLSSQKK